MKPLKSTIFSYLSNSKNSGQLGLQAASTAITREFEKGRTSYFRTDGFFHSPLKILKEKGIDPLVAEAIRNKPKVSIEEFDGSYFINADKYMLTYMLNIASPFEFLTQGSAFQEQFAKKKKKPMDYEDEPENMFVGLEQRLQEYQMLNKRDALPDFNFENFIQECSARIKAKENEISEKDIEAVSHRIPVKFNYEELNF